MKRVDLLDLPTYPSTSLKFSAIVSAIMSLDNTTLCAIQKGYYSIGNRSIGSIVKATIEDVSITLRGLDLNSFKVCGP